jgi:DNA invertase Pin-like site-specific DNA recombinase
MKKEIDYKSLRYVMYCRRSSEDASDKQIQSIETQLRELQETQNRDGLNIIEIITESQSAHKPGRPGFARFIRLIESGKADALLVVRGNRISRNALDAGQVIYLMDQNKLKYIKTSSGSTYKNTPGDKAMLQLELVFSKKDSDDKSEAVKEGFRTKYLKGTPGGVAPIGYKNTPHLEHGSRY